MLDTKTPDKKILANLRNIIDNNDVETVMYIRNVALKKLSHLKIAEASGDITARERMDMAINIEIITLAEGKMNAVAVF